MGNTSSQMQGSPPALPYLFHIMAHDIIFLNGVTLMSLVSWYDPIPFHFCIFSISTLILTYYDAWNRRDASCELRESTRSRARSMLDFR